MEKNVSVKLNGNRVIKGTLRGYDQFMNLVLIMLARPATRPKI